MASSRKVLVAFDFDHTIIEENSDLYVRKLAPGGKIPKSIKKKYSPQGWTEFMAAIFQYLHENKVTSEDIINCMKEIEFVNGMPELFDHIRHGSYDNIIISDSNSVFIDCIMKDKGYSEVVNETYTNPAEFENSGCLTIQYYHTQDWCDLSTRNLCKGHILEEHIAKQKEKGVCYDIVVYVGDGSNDLCPVLRLRPCDYAFSRVGYKLDEMLKDNDGNVKCNVVSWENGADILEVLKSLEKKS